MAIFYPSACKLLFAVLILFCFQTLAQPKITSFNPARGPVGMSVTLNGSGFDPAPSNNVVYFGPARATVTAGSASHLVVAVPAGTTYQPISVVNQAAGLTGYSSLPFTPTFTNPFGSGIPANFYRPKTDFAARGIFTYSVAFGDLDGDGKPDIAVANFASSNVSVLRNTTGTGDITAASFAAAVNYGTGLNPYAMAAGDADGDGKPDLITANTASNTVSILRNTAASGSITASSFVSKIDVGTGIYPLSVALGDLDGDGIADLASANAGSGDISVFKIAAPSSASVAAASTTDISMRVYPNPTAGEYVVQLQLKASTATVEVLNESGSCCRETNRYPGQQNGRIRAKAQFAPSPCRDILCKSNQCTWHTNYQTDGKTLSRDLHTLSIVTTHELYPAQAFLAFIRQEKLAILPDCGKDCREKTLMM